MAFVITDRVRETSTTTGTGNFTLAGAVTGYQTFDAALDTGDTTYYAIADQGGVNWEVGIGTFTSPSTLARTTILSSSNGGSVVTFGAGTKDVFISLPSSKTNVEDQPNLIEVNSSSAALRITQTGAGNALVVEDSANPDSSPVAVDADGRVLVGYTSSIPAVLTGQFQLTGTTNSGGSIQQLVYSAAANAPRITLGRSNSGTVGTNAVVLIDENMGEIRFVGNDGTGFVRGAAIAGVVDGTPGTNDMPGRLIFSTTADGASIPTERMRIDSAGQVGIGTSSITGYRLRIGGSITGATTSYGGSLDLAVSSDVTSIALGVHTNISTQAASFTLANLRHYSARQSTIGAGSIVTNQYGYWADSTITGATNNYGFYGNIASGTGRWNFYANGTADNYFAGQVQLGAGTVSAPALSTTGDTNTGIFFPAADTIAFAEGGVEAMRINSSGNVGIGTSSPGSLLTVNGDLAFNSGYGSAAVAYGCRAWVNFNGTGTVAIRASGNVSSITDNGTGDYTVNFTTAMPDANYSSVAGCAKNDGNNDGNQIAQVGGYLGALQTSSTCRIRTVYVSLAAQDSPQVTFAAFR